MGTDDKTKENEHTDASQTYELDSDQKNSRKELLDHFKQVQLSEQELYVFDSNTQSMRPLHDVHEENKSDPSANDENYEPKIDLSHTNHETVSGELNTFIDALQKGDIKSEDLKTTNIEFIYDESLLSTHQDPTLNNAFHISSDEEEKTRNNYWQAATHHLNNLSKEELDELDETAKSLLGDRYNSVKKSFTESDNQQVDTNFSTDKTENIETSYYFDRPNLRF